MRGGGKGPSNTSLPTLAARRHKPPKRNTALEMENVRRAV